MPSHSKSLSSWTGFFEEKGSPICWWEQPREIYFSITFMATL